MKLAITAPSRADIAGGTLDIWPLAFLFPDACTINVAVDAGVTAADAGVAPARSDGAAIRERAKYVSASCEPAALHAWIARSDASIAGSVRYIVTPSQIVRVGAVGVGDRGEGP